MLPSLVCGWCEYSTNNDNVSAESNTHPLIMLSRPSTMWARYEIWALSSGKIGPCMEASWARHWRESWAMSESSRIFLCICKQDKPSLSICFYMGVTRTLTIYPLHYTQYTEGLCHILQLTVWIEKTKEQEKFLWYQHLAKKCKRLKVVVLFQFMCPVFECYKKSIPANKGLHVGKNKPIITETVDVVIDSKERLLVPKCHC